MPPGPDPPGAPMVRLTDLLGRPVRGHDGRPVGRVTDLVAKVGGAAPVVTAVVVRAGRESRRIDWGQVPRFGPEGVELAPDALLADAVLARSELLVRRDVLDVQVLDVRGHRAARVADVMLGRRGDGRLIVVAVDVGLGGIVHRLGLHRWAARRPESLVGWDHLHLISRRGHEVQLTTPDAPIHQLPPDELARLLGRLPTAHARDIVTRAPDERRAQTLASVHPHVGRRILSAMDEAEAERVLRSLPAEHERRWRDELARHVVPHRRYRRHRIRRREARETAR